MANEVVKDLWITNEQGVESQHPIGADATNVSYSKSGSTTTVKNELDAFNTHITNKVNSANGVHNLRYYGNALSYKDDNDQWQPITTGGSSSGDMQSSEQAPQGVILTTKGGTGNNSGYIRAGLESGSTAGSNSTAEGLNVKAIGNKSHAEGELTQAYGDQSHAEGLRVSAIGNKSHAEGISSNQWDLTTLPDTSAYINNYGFAAGAGAHSEGNNTQAVGDWSHTEGNKTQATGLCSHAEGGGAQATENYAHAEGGAVNNGSIVASGMGAHAEGFADEGSIVASGDGAHAEGYTINTITASGDGAHAEGNDTTASGDYSHAEGQGTIATHTGSHAEGYTSEARYDYAHAEGYYTIASGNGAHSEGSGYSGGEVEASGHGAHAEGYASGTDSAILAIGDGAHAEGRALNGDTINASGVGAHAEGICTQAAGNGAHAEGYYTQATGDGAHAEGYYTIATGYYSHAEGYYTETEGAYSHASGEYTKALGESSFVTGMGTSENQATLTGNAAFGVLNDSFNKFNEFNVGSRFAIQTTPSTSNNINTVDGAFICDKTSSSETYNLQSFTEAGMWVLFIGALKGSNLHMSSWFIVNMSELGLLELKSNTPTATLYSVTIDSNVIKIYVSESDVYLQAQMIRIA